MDAPGFEDAQFSLLGIGQILADGSVAFSARVNASSSDADEGAWIADSNGLSLIYKEADVLAFDLESNDQSNSPLGFSQRGVALIQSDRRRVLAADPRTGDIFEAAGPGTLVRVPGGPPREILSLQQSSSTIQALGDTGASGDVVFRAFFTDGTSGLVRTRVALWGCSPADIAAPFDSVNMTDVQTFLDDFTAHRPTSDLNGDLRFDLIDVQGFLIAFAGGCP